MNALASLNPPTPGHQSIKKQGLMAQRLQNRRSATECPDWCRSVEVVDGRFAESTRCADPGDRPDQSPQEGTIGHGSLALNRRRLEEIRKGAAPNGIGRLGPALDDVADDVEHDR